MSWFDVLKISTEEAISDAKRFAPEMIEEGKKLNQEEKERNKKLQWEKFQPNLKKIVNIFQEWLNKTPKDVYTNKGPQPFREKQIDYDGYWKNTLFYIERFVEMASETGKYALSNFEEFDKYYESAIDEFTRRWRYKQNLHIGNDKIKEIERLRGKSYYALD
tara:strand:- start:1293 stop:1778 length:486 start_codon:yes stop_codon:yes gene_type:complete